MPTTTTRSAKEIGQWNWQFTSDGNDHYSHDQIQSATRVTIRHELKTLRSLFQLMLNRMDSLGTDGLHLILREHARKIRAAKTRKKTPARR